MNKTQSVKGKWKVALEKKSKNKIDKKNMETSITYDYDDDYNYNNENDNLKKILCHNIIFNTTCKYGNKCLYAHNLDEQNINSNRKCAYDILNNNNQLNNIDLKKNIYLYKALLSLTKICENCNKNKCIGGYNCKSGACSKKYCICVDDLNYGICKCVKCDLVHLTKRGLKPYYQKTILNQDNKLNNKKQNNECSSVSSDNISIDSIENVNTIQNTILQIKHINIEQIQYYCEKSIFE